MSGSILLLTYESICINKKTLISPPHSRKISRYRKNARKNETKPAHKDEQAEPATVCRTAARVYLGKEAKLTSALFYKNRTYLLRRSIDKINLILQFTIFHFVVSDSALRERDT